MTANKLKVVGAAVAVLVIAAAALILGRHGGPSASGAQDAAANDAAHAQAKTATRKTDKPLWRDLTPAQQAALQPLQGEWDATDGARKQKWLQLANRFAALKPEQRQRVQERMREWVKLTPEQRELARETYNRTRKITPDEKTNIWESYQQLPEEQKRKLAASPAGRKAGTVGPSNIKTPPLGRGAVSCPAGTIRNSVSAVPPCVAVPVPVVPAPVPTLPPLQPPPQPQPEKVPDNWGISPNNA